MPAHHLQRMRWGLLATTTGLAVMTAGVLAALGGLGWALVGGDGTVEGLTALGDEPAAAQGSDASDSSDTSYAGGVAMLVGGVALLVGGCVKAAGDTVERRASGAAASSE